jgi:hypothetical protein
MGGTSEKEQTVQLKETSNIPAKKKNNKQRKKMVG